MPNGVSRIVLFPVRAGIPKPLEQLERLRRDERRDGAEHRDVDELPSPVASRTRSAERIPISPNSGEIRSANGIPILTGGSPSSPDSIMIPESAWITVS